MRLQFSKMHGLGNDFVVLDAINQTVSLSPAQLRFIADRHLGVGCDQILLVEPADLPGIDFRYRIFNRDGGEVEQCGNGARCFARFVRDRGLIDKDNLTVQTNAGTLELRIETDGRVSVVMGVPEFTPEKIPFVAEQQADRYDLDVAEQTVRLGVVAIGNPHAVIRVDDIERAPLTTLGPAIERHTRFPKRVNVGFLQIVSPDCFKLRVFERGVGETMACGSGACAAMVIGRHWNLLNETVRAQLRGGTLTLNWPGHGQAVRMTGPAQHVFDGELEL